MDLLDAFQKYKNLYRIYFQDGLEVYFRLLTHDEYLAFTRLYPSQAVYPSAIEDEILKRAIINNEILAHEDILRAGALDTVLKLIMKFSSIEYSSETGAIGRFNDLMSSARTLANHPENFTTTFICRAFPAYKPEDVEQMDLNTRALRLAQAETILMRTGFIEEPIELKPLKQASSVDQFLSDAREESKNPEIRELMGTSGRPLTRDEAIRRTMEQIKQMKLARKG